MDPLWPPTATQDQFLQLAMNAEEKQLAKIIKDQESVLFILSLQF